MAIPLEELQAKQGFTTAQAGQVSWLPEPEYVRVPSRFSRLAAQYRRTFALARRAASAALRSGSGAVASPLEDSRADDRNDPPPSAASGYRTKPQ